MANMDENTDPAVEAVTDAAAASAMNDQITDALKQLHAILAGADESTIQVAAYQVFVHAVALAMHNAVAEQQHNHILRMAMTTSAAKAILAGRKAEAEAILDLARTKLASPDLSDLLDQVRLFIQAIGRELHVDGKTPAQAVTVSAFVFTFFNRTPVTLSCLGSSTSVTTESQIGLIFGWASVRSAMILEARSASRRCTRYMMEPNRVR